MIGTLNLQNRILATKSIYRLFCITVVDNQVLPSNLILNSPSTEKAITMIQLQMKKMSYTETEINKER